MNTPQTKYAKSGQVHIAYQVIGEGPLDLVKVPGWISNVELAWENAEYTRFLQRLASFSRLVVFDKRGTGLSDRVSEADLPDLPPSNFYRGNFETETEPSLCRTISAYAIIVLPPNHEPKFAHDQSYNRSG